jgi:dTDP-4-dehydrorhamnose 3,5-epimerase-like enzyme
MHFSQNNKCQGSYGFWKVLEIGQGVFHDLKGLGKSDFVIMAMEKLWKFMSLL